MQSFYATATNYRDEGAAFAAGDEARIHFTTVFNRGTGLSFEFSGARQAPTRLLGTLSQARIVDANSEATGPLLSMTGALSGVSRLSARIVPVMLFGVDFCECLDSDEARLESVEVLDGRKTHKIRLGRAPGRVIVLWLDADDAAIAKLEREPASGEGAPTVTIEYRRRRP